jgi:hypothetical protein
MLPSGGGGEADSASECEFEFEYDYVYDYKYKKPNDYKYKYGGDGQSNHDERNEGEWAQEEWTQAALVLVNSKSAAEYDERNDGEWAKVEWTQEEWDAWNAWNAREAGKKQTGAGVERVEQWDEETEWGSRRTSWDEESELGDEQVQREVCNDEQGECEYEYEHDYVYEYRYKKPNDYKYKYTYDRPPRFSPRVPVPRPLVDAMTQHVEDVSERFAISLHLTLSLAFDDAPSSSADLVLLNGKSVADYVSAIDYRSIVHALLRFQCCHPQDLESLFVLTLVYLRQMKSRSALPLLEQMIAWFDVSNVVYCNAFLAHVWLFDKTVPLQDWHGIAEGVVKGVDLNKCVRNCLRILQYRLFPNAKAVRCATLALDATLALELECEECEECEEEALECEEKPRVTVDIAGYDPEAVIRAKTNPTPRAEEGVVQRPEEELRRLRPTARSQLSRPRTPFARVRCVRRP